jgi:hypothetical protein
VTSVYGTSTLIRAFSAKSNIAIFVPVPANAPTNVLAALRTSSVPLLC